MAPGRHNTVSSEPTVFVVDADAATRNAVRDLVSAMSFRCETYASGQEFMDGCPKSRPGCVVLEVKLLGIGGIQIQRHLKAQGNDIPIFFLTAYPELSIAVEAMRSGAVHFLQKPLRSNELWYAIQEAIDLDEEQQRAREWQALVQRRLRSLTAKEMEVLTLIGHGKTSRQIATVMGIAVRTVEVHRAHLVQKIKAKSLREVLDVGIFMVKTGIAPPVPQSRVDRESEEIQ